MKITVHSALQFTHLFPATKPQTNDGGEDYTPSREWTPAYVHPFVAMCRAAVANGRGGEVVAALPRARLLRYALTASSAAVQGLRVGAIRLDTTEYKMLRAQFKEWTPCAKLSPNGEVKRQGWESLNASKYDESDITEANATLSRVILSSRISKS